MLIYPIAVYAVLELRLSIGEEESKRKTPLATAYLDSGAPIPSAKYPFPRWQDAYWWLSAQKSLVRCVDSLACGSTFQCIDIDTIQKAQSLTIPVTYCRHTLRAVYE